MIERRPWGNGPGSPGGLLPMRVNLGRKSWSEQQLARAWATSAFVLARQPASRGPVSPGRGATGRGPLTPQRSGPRTAAPAWRTDRADPTEWATTQQRPPMLHQTTQQLGIGLTQDPIRPMAPRPTQGYQALPPLEQQLHLPANTIQYTYVFNSKIVGRQVGDQHQPLTHHPLTLTDRLPFLLQLLLELPQPGTFSDAADRRGHFHQWT